MKVHKSVRGSKPTRLIFAIILFLIIAMGIATPLLASDSVTDPTNTSYNSRFKIFTAEHEAVSKSGKVDKMQSIFKIDLETGTVWRYRQGVDQKGKHFEEFFEVPNQ